MSPTSYQAAPPRAIDTTRLAALPQPLDFLKAWLLRSLTRQSNELPHRTVVSTSFSDLIPVTPTAGISVAFDCVEIVGGVPVARHDSCMGELVNNYIPWLWFLVGRADRRVENGKVVVVASCD